VELTASAATIWEEGAVKRAGVRSKARRDKWLLDKEENTMLAEECHKQAENTQLRKAVNTNEERRLKRAIS
jgi:hypothetical protein